MFPLCVLRHTWIHFACCGTLGASEESSAHTTGSFEIAALVFRFAERRHAVASPRLVRKTAQVKASRQPMTNLTVHYPQKSKTAQVKASRQPMTNLTVHYPQKSELLESTNCIYKICCVSPKVVYTKLLYLARKYTDLLYLARSHPPSELCENIFELWEIVGAVQSTRRAGQQRHHAELWRWIVMA